MKIPDAIAEVMIVTSKGLLVVIAILFESYSTLDAESLWHSGKNAQDIVSSSAVNKARADFVELSKTMNPTVVNIFTTQTIRFGGTMQGGIPGEGPDDLFRLFEEMLGQRGGRRFYFSRPVERKATALGSGFIINSEGYVITNNHVVNNADSIKVKLYNGEEYGADLKGVDPETDLALIKIKTKGKKSFEYANLGDSSKTEVGEWVIAIGNPLGLSHSVTAGIVSAKGKVIPEISIYNDYIQTDASINQGNSGGPLINTRGEVIGINTAIIRQAQGVAIEGIGFAIPINMAKKVLPQLAKGAKVSHQRGWLGISMGEIDSSIAEYLGIKPDTEGVIVAEVVPHSPAAKAGLKSYDLITAFDGKPVKSSQDLVVAVKRAEPGKKYGIDIIRKGKHRKLDVVLSTEKDDSYASPGGPDAGGSATGSVSSYGIYADDLDRETIKKYRLQGVTPYHGVLVVQVESNSPAARANIKVGDIILEVNQQQIKNTRDF
ncbi:MAG: Do family serine endopeptidase, partial [Oligoflexia bacterium]|nr:Do family serine endopeptidase [Oligoflexia bacterium]